MEVDVIKKNILDQLYSFMTDNGIKILNERCLDSYGFELCFYETTLLYK